MTTTIDTLLAAAVTADAATDDMITYVAGATSTQTLTWADQSVGTTLHAIMALLTELVSEVDALSP